MHACTLKSKKKKKKEEILRKAYLQCYLSFLFSPSGSRNFSLNLSSKLVVAAHLSCGLASLNTPIGTMASGSVQNVHVLQPWS